MTTNASVVTSERFKKGLSFQEFLKQAKVNVDRFEQYYQTAKEILTPDDIAFFKGIAARPNGAKRVIVLGEDWCPDVYRGMPLVVRIAEAAGMEAKIFPRDTNIDIMNEFLKDGQFQSIPAVVFYTADQKYICHWIERPKQAYEETAQITKELEKTMTGQGEEAIRNARRQRTQARYPEWQKATVKELRQMLAKALGK